MADGNTVRRIVRLAGVGPGARVVEIGAGLGSLTLALAEAGARVTAVEVDRHVVPVLRGVVEPLGVEVVAADALAVDFTELREVGERLAARARDEAYGAVSVKVAYWASASVVGKVPASVFIPRPRVESVLVKLDRHPGGTDGAHRGPPGPGTPGYDRLFAVVKGGFAHRRKMLRRSLEHLVTAEAFAGAGIAPTARAEELDLAEWERLAWWRPDEPSVP